MNDWFRPVPEGALLCLRVTPNAGRTAIEGVAVLADGTIALKLRITAQPEGGRANQAAIALLAKASGLPKSAFSVRSGASARNKTIMLTASARNAQAARQGIEAAIKPG